MRFAIIAERSYKQQIITILGASSLGTVLAWQAGYYALLQRYFANFICMI